MTLSRNHREEGQQSTQSSQEPACMWSSIPVCVSVCVQLDEDMILTGFVEVWEQSSEEAFGQTRRLQGCFEGLVGRFVPAEEIPAEIPWRIPTGEEILVEIPRGIP